MPAFLPGEPRGQRSLVLQSMGSQRVGHDWNDLALTHREVIMGTLHLGRSEPLDTDGMGMMAAQTEALQG